MYLSSTAVCCDEAMKLVTCLGILAFTYLFQKKRKEGSDGGSSGSGGLFNQLINTSGETHNGTSCVSDGDNEMEIEIEKLDDRNVTYPITISHESFRSYLSEQLQFDFRMAGLAALYTVQKNLLYLAISNLDAAVFQVTYQTKVLTTAVFSVLLLKRKLSKQQVVALVLLTLGVALVQLDKVEDNASKSYQEQRRWVGVVAVLGACCTSGFGGVYFELVLKPHTNAEETSSTPIRPPPSVWAKNVQLSTFGLVIALATAFVKDGSAIVSNGFFQGYTPVVLTVITLQAGGGLVVAAIIKYADNILKSFATAMSIVSSTLISAWVFDFSISSLFVVGCLIQFTAIWLYSRKEESVDSTSGCKLQMQTSEIALMRMSPSIDRSFDGKNMEIQDNGNSLIHRSGRSIC